MCAYEFKYTGACNKRTDCTFNHEISDTQRQNLEIKAKMEKQLSEIQNRRKQYGSNRDGSLEKKDENVVVPKRMLEEMYKMLNESPPQHF